MRGNMNSVATHVNNFKMSHYYEVLLCLLIQTQWWFDPLCHSATHRLTNFVSYVGSQPIVLDICCMKNVDDIQVLVISCLGSSSLVANLSKYSLQPLHNSSTTLQTAFNLRKFSRITSLPPLPSLPSLAVCSCSYQIQSPVLAYQPLKGSAPLVLPGCGYSPAHCPSMLCFKVLTVCYKMPVHHVFTLVPFFWLPNVFLTPVWTVKSLPFCGWIISALNSFAL